MGVMICCYVMRNNKTFNSTCSSFGCYSYEQHVNVYTKRICRAQIYVIYFCTSLELCRLSMVCLKGQMNSSGFSGVVHSSSGASYSQDGCPTGFVLLRKTIETYFMTIPSGFVYGKVWKVMTSTRYLFKDSNLVDSASSHTLVSKIKPCMSKYKSFTLKLRMAHYISYSLFDSPLLLG